MSTIYNPKKRKYAQNDPFFEEGNIALRAFWLQKEAQSQLEIDMIIEQANNLSSKYATEIYCDECQIELPSIPAYELHYDAVHCNVCSTCNKIFPGSEWLQLHLDEWHNVILQLKKERGDPIYKCFVSNCNELLSTPEQRQLHLIETHQYPAYFPFDLVETGTLSFEERKQRDEQFDQDMDELTERLPSISFPMD